MRTAVLLLLLGTLALLLCCGRTEVKGDPAVAAVDSSLTGVDQWEQERLEKRLALDKEHVRDSIALDQILQDALTVARKHGGSDRFRESYAVWMPDSLFEADVDAHSDVHFSKAKPHLVIRRSTPNALYIDIYIQDNDRYQQVLSHEQWAMTYVNDTVQDINGDGLHDFVVNWYGASGCCLKAFSNVYLQRPDHTFSSDFEFINPTFSPGEHMIRGVCYGHPGETELYKYRWHGEAVDTLEYVHYEKDERGKKTGKVIRSTAPPYGEGYRVLSVRDAVPQEYRKIGGYDWFTGLGYE